MDEYPVIDLSHLLPAAQGLARLPADERIQRIRADRWIGYPRAVEALNRLETLYAWPNKQRMPNLLLVGPTNNGKSMIVEKFRRAHPVGTDADQEHIPVLVVQMPSEPSVIRFYVALLAAMGAPLRPRPRLPEMEQLALALLRMVGVRMLVIDELHNVLAGNSVNRREFLNLLRFLGNELRIPLVGVGTREAYLAIRSDDQLENRFEPMLLPEGVAAMESAELWNLAEGAEKRKNATVARELLVALPHELDTAQRQALAEAIAGDLVKRYQVGAQVAVHLPDAEGDNRNHHAHILFTTRRLSSDGLGEKTRELDDLKRGPEEVQWIRAMVEGRTNAALEAAGHAERVDRRSLADKHAAALEAGDQVKAMETDRAPTIHDGPAITEARREAERRGKPAPDLDKLARSDQRELAQVSAKIYGWEAAT
ncbi:TniB family NTP-binding protein [Pseudomonas aeruginosa]|uniref:TniB family NTP-binding protein n=1 Tax=Pseudomonas aeruginosa TaxID=287 RepID=UPI003F1BC22B